MAFVTTGRCCETHVEGSKRNHVINVGPGELHASPLAPFDRTLIDFTRTFISLHNSTSNAQFCIGNMSNIPNIYARFHKDL